MYGPVLRQHVPTPDRHCMDPPSTSISINTRSLAHRPFDHACMLCSGRAPPATNRRRLRPLFWETCIWRLSLCIFVTACSGAVNAQSVTSHKRIARREMAARGGGGGPGRTVLGAPSSSSSLLLPLPPSLCAHLPPSLPTHLLPPSLLPPSSAVSNIPFGVTEEQLTEVFEQAGRVVSFR